MRRLIVQSIGDGDDVFRRYLDLSAPVHERYAERCGADYLFHVGLVDEAPSLSWNRVPLMLDAFSDGYDEVVWLDADTLVVDMAVNVFDATPSAPIQMVREHGTLHRGFGVDVWNAGVMVLDHRAMNALSWIWSKRAALPLDHHIDWYYEQNWTIDWCIDHPDEVVELDKRWNWMPWEGGTTPESEATIKAWHGWPDEFRWVGFAQAYSEHCLNEGAARGGGAS